MAWIRWGVRDYIRLLPRALKCCLLGLALAVVTSGISCYGPEELPPVGLNIGPHDFVKDSPGSEREAGSRIYLGLGGNGVLLGAMGDAPAWRSAGLAGDGGLIFGSLWSSQQRHAPVELKLSPCVPVEGSYSQTVDLDTGLAVTRWQYRAFPLRTFNCRVQTVVSPDGTIGWRVRTNGPGLRLTLRRVDATHGQWDLSPELAVMTVKTGEMTGRVAVRPIPAVKWRRQPGDLKDGGEAITARLAPEAEIVLTQRVLGRRPAGQAPPGLSEPDFQSLVDRTAAFWRAFWLRSSVMLPDSELQKWYCRSLYYLASISAGSAYPPGPMGPCPDRWRGHIFGHDNTYIHYALLTSNHPEVARQYVNWYLQVLPAAQDNAMQQYGMPGARYGWEQNWRGDELAPEPFRHEHHVNAHIAWQAYMQVYWTNDEELLEDIKPLLRDTGEFLAAHLQWNDATESFLSPSSVGLDEDARETPGAVSTQTGAAWLAQVCHDLECSTAAIERIRGKIYLPTVTTSDGPVLTAYHGDDLARPMKHPSPLVGVWWLPVLNPDSDVVRRTFDATLQRVDLDATPTFNRPWLAAVAARMGDGERAYTLLRALLKADGAIVDDISFTETQGTRWTHFATTCGALVSSVNEMLLQSWQKGKIAVFPGVPSDWGRRGVSFERLLARGGIHVSAHWRDQEIAVTLQAGKRSGSVTLSLPSVGSPESPAQLTVGGRPITYQRLSNGRLALPVALTAGSSCTVVATAPR